MSDKTFENKPEYKSVVAQRAARKEELIGKITREFWDRIAQFDWDPVEIPKIPPLRIPQPDGDVLCLELKDLDIHKLNGVLERLQTKRVTPTSRGITIDDPTELPFLCLDQNGNSTYNYKKPEFGNPIRAIPSTGIHSHSKKTV